MQRFRREVLERARLDAGLSRGDLAQKSGVARITIYDAETGASTQPRPKTVKALAEALGIEVAELYVDTPDLDGAA
jgi:transcriptional regulator with XRE-family HTH domain